MSTIVLLAAVDKTKQPQQFANHNLPFTLFLFSRFEPSSSSQKQVTSVRKTKKQTHFLKTVKIRCRKNFP